MTTEYREEVRKAAEPERFCGRFCKISIGIDVLFWILQIFALNCGPLTLLAYYVLGIIVSLKEEHLDLPGAMLLLAQMSTTVGYGSTSFGSEPTRKSGLKLWHSLHSWMGVVMVNSQWDTAIDAWFWGILETCHKEWKVPKKVHVHFHACHGPWSLEPGLCFRS